MSNTRHAQYEWRPFRTALTALTDDDWADDESDALPSDTFPVTSGRTPHGKTVKFEFFVLGYVASTGVLADNDSDTFSCDVTYIIDTAGFSTAIGRGATGLARSGNTAANALKVAVAGPTMAGLKYFKPYTVECSGAAEVALRLHSATGAPGSADRYDVWIREIPQ